MLVSQVHLAVYGQRATPFLLDGERQTYSHFRFLSLPVRRIFKKTFNHSRCRTVEQLRHIHVLFILLLHYHLQPNSSASYFITSLLCSLLALLNLRYHHRDKIAVVYR